MVSFRQWGSRPITASDLGTTIQITKMPKQYPVRRILVTLRAVFEVLAGGTTDYTIGNMFGNRIFKNIQFSVGSGNLLKDVPGFANWFTTSMFHPYQPNITMAGPGSTMGVGDTLNVAVGSIIDFEDPNTLASDLTVLLPSLYEDITLNLGLSAINELTTAGDRPFTFNGVLSVMILQENDLTTVVSDVLREWTQTTDITSTGKLEIDLPRSLVLEQIIIYPLQDGIPTLGVIDDTQTISIDIENGVSIPYEMYPQDITTQLLTDYSMMDLSALMSGDFTPIYPLNMDVNHDGQSLIDGRRLTKWTLKLTANYDALYTRKIMLHFVGRNQMPIQRT